MACFECMIDVFEGKTEGGEACHFQRDCFTKTLPRVLQSSRMLNFDTDECLTRCSQLMGYLVPKEGRRCRDRRSSAFVVRVKRVTMSLGNSAFQRLLI
jgi:hypothetical protein